MLHLHQREQPDYEYNYPVALVIITHSPGMMYSLIIRTETRAIKKYMIVHKGTHIKVARNTTSTTTLFLLLNIRSVSTTISDILMCAHSLIHRYRYSGCLKGCAKRKTAPDEEIADVIRLISERSPALSSIGCAASSAFRSIRAVDGTLSTSASSISAILPSLLFRVRRNENRLMAMSH